MPELGRRSRSKRRNIKTLPGGRRTVHYNQRGISTHHCNLCGRPLGGTANLPTAEIQKLNRTKKTVSRPYGGELCPQCLKKTLRYAVRTL